MSSPPPTGRIAAAVVGLLSVAAALGAGHLVAGLLLIPQASPFLAVGNAAIDRTPTPVKEFAVATFGNADKAVLLIGMAVVIALVAVVAGLVARRAVWPGLAVVGVLGVVGVLAVLEQASSPIALLAPLVAAGTGV
ncbi:MAG: molybdopterin-binding protein, partial [Pseudonocardia sp.]|nr:molybdopterin-binding protein [Pseudonocardia sp.]